MGTAKAYEGHADTVEELNKQRSAVSVVSAQLRAQLKATTSSLTTDVQQLLHPCMPVPEGKKEEQFRAEAVSTVAGVLSVAIPAGSLTALLTFGPTVATAAAASVQRAKALNIGVTAATAAEYL